MQRTSPPQGIQQRPLPSNLQARPPTARSPNSAFQPPALRRRVPDSQAQPEKVYLQDPDEFADEHHDRETIDFLDDKKKDMTWGRRIALTLKRFSLYYPEKSRQSEGEAGAETETERDVISKFSATRPGAIGAYPFTTSKQEYPSLAKAWAYFEHFALPRYVVSDDEGLDSAEPGENNLPTRLYNPYCTPHRQLGDYGLGIGLYFTTLRALCILTFFCGVVSIPNMIYFGSDDYSGGQDGLRTELKGSAICTETAWVLCEDCEDHVFPDSRIRHGFNEALGQSATFYLQNKCNGTTVEQSMINLGVLVLMCVGILIMNVRIKRVETEFDEDEQTAQDYSIVISNPPIDAYNPEEWRIFFRDNFQAYVTTCTVGVDNDLLVNSLVERREKLKKIEMSVKPGTSLDTLTLAQIAAKHEEKRRFFGRLMAIFSPGIPELVHRVVVLNCKVQGLAQESKPVSNVFVTFETEADQRKVLNLMLNGGAVHAKDLLFRGTHVLKVKEPDEPNTIRWQDLNETNMQKLKQQFFTSFATFVSIVVMAVIVRVCNDWSVVYSAFAISIANVMFPSFAKALTNLEAHHSEGTKQRSLYFKIALFRLVNTAVVITIIRSFSETLVDEEGLIQQVYSLFFTEIVTTTALQLADIGGHVSRHFLAPRAKTQDAMNLAMQGTSVELAERFTNMTKILFLALWYCSIFPAALFLCSFALFINYFIDRFSLMRSWKRMPQLGTEISKLSRYYFFPTALTAMAILSSYYWSGFPFDNLCQKDGEFVKESFVGEWVIDPKEDAKEGEIDDTVIVSVNATTPNTVHCRQDLLRYYPEDWKVRIRFPFSPNFQSEGLEWMTDDQETATGIWSWVAVAFAALLAVLFTVFFF